MAALPSASDWSRRYLTKQRHTARQHEIEGRINYPFHPRCGETVLITRQFAFRDVEVVVIRHPDGADRTHAGVDDGCVGGAVQAA